MQPTKHTGYLFQHVAASLARQSDQILQEQLGIGFSQYKLMMVLQWNSGIQQRQIADSLGQTEASISRQIKLMHEDGLLQTVISPSNRREHLTTLTPKGLRMTREAQKLFGKVHSPVFAALNEKQQKQLTDTLKLMHGEVCKGSRPGRCYQDYLDAIEKEAK